MDFSRKTFFNGWKGSGTFDSIELIFLQWSQPRVGINIWRKFMGCKCQSRNLKSLNYFLNRAWHHQLETRRSLPSRATRACRTVSGMRHWYVLKERIYEKEKWSVLKFLQSEACAKDNTRQVRILFSNDCHQSKSLVHQVCVRNCSDAVSYVKVIG